MAAFKTRDVRRVQPGQLCQPHLTQACRLAATPNAAPELLLPAQGVLCCRRHCA